MESNFNNNTPVYISQSSSRFGGMPTSNNSSSYEDTTEASGEDYTSSQSGYSTDTYQAEYLDWTSPSKYLNLETRYLCPTCGGRVPCPKGCYLNHYKDNLATKGWIFATQKMLGLLRVSPRKREIIVANLLNIAIYFERNIKSKLSDISMDSECLNRVIALISESFIIAIAFRQCKKPIHRYAILSAACFRYLGPSALQYLMKKNIDLSDQMKDDEWVPESFMSFVEKFEDVFDNEIVESITTIFYEAVHLHLIPEWAVSRLKYCINVNHYVPKGPVSIVTLLSALAGLADACVNGLSRHLKGEKTLKVPTMRSFLRDYNLIKLDVDFVKFSNSNDHDKRVTIFDHMRRIRDCIKVAKELQNLNRRNWRTIDPHLRNLKQWELEYSILNAGINRDAPIGIVLHGLPGIGKSSLLPAIYKIWCKSQGKEYDQNMVYNRDIRSQYWSKYDPFSHPIIHYSELGSTHPNLVQKSGDSVLSEVLSVIDTAPFPVNMAEVENKGKVFVMPKMVVIDTNNEELNAKHAVHSPSAVLRRFIYVHARVKPKFDNGYGGLDPNKITPQDNPMDLWTFDVYTKTPVGPMDTEKVFSYKANIPLNMGGLRDVLLQYISKRASDTAIQERAVSLDPDDYVESNFEAESIISAFNVVASKIAWAMTMSWPERWFYTMRANCWRFYYVVLFFTFTWRTLEEYKSRACYRFYKTETNLVRNLIIAGVVITSFKICLCLTSTISTFVSEMTLAEAEDKIGVDFPLPRKRADGDTTYREVPSFSRRVFEDSRKSNHPTQVINSIKNNVRYFRIFYTDGSSAMGQMLGIRGNMAVMNNHYFDYKDIEYMTISKSNKVAQQYVNVNVKSLTTKKVGNDLIFVFLPSLLFKNIVKLLPISSETLSGYVCNVEDSRPIIKGEEPLEINSTGDNYILTDYVSYKNSNHGPGTCGTPLIVRAENYTMVAGIHTAGNKVNDQCLVAVVTMDMAEDTFSECGDKWGVMFSEGEIRLPKDLSLSAIHPKHPFNYENTHQLTVMGDIKGTRLISGKSSLVKYPFFDDLERLFRIPMRNNNGKLKFGKPVMKPIKVKGSYLSPYNNWVRKLEKRPNRVSLSVLENVTNSFFQHITSKITTVLAPLSADIAIKGYDQDFYTRAMNKQTSAGFGYEGKKKEFLNLSEDAQSIMCHELELDVIRMYEDYSTRDTLSHPIINATMKDEVLPIDKVEAAKTRFFCASPMQAIIVQSMLLKPFYSLMTANRDIFMCKIGINMDSREADSMYRKLATGMIMEGDYSGYDTTLPFQFAQASNNLTIRICKHYGYNDQACKVLRGILEDGLFPHLNLRGSLFCAPGLQPSGKVGTAEDNSLKGVLLLAYYFAILYTPYGEGHKFNENKDFHIDDFWQLSLWVYGDDMIASIKTCYPAFNAMNYSEFCDFEYGMKFTASNKGEVQSNYVTTEDMTFLKRHFIYSRTLKRYVAPLDKDSILKSLMYYLPSKYTSEATQATETFNAALRQMFFWLDNQEQFDKLAVQCRVLLIKYYNLDETALIHYLPTHERLLNHFTSKVKWKAESSLEQDIERDVAKTRDEQESKLPGGMTNIDGGFTESNTDVRTVSNNMPVPKPMSPTQEELLNNFVFVTDLKFPSISFYPYILWLQQPHIWRIMRNYANFRCDLEIRFEWAVKPTDYGYGFAAHYPAPMHNPTLISYLANTFKRADLIIPYLSQNSVSTEIWYEQASTATLHIPFMYYHNMIEIGGSYKNWLHEFRVLSMVWTAIVTNEMYPIKVYIRGKNVSLGQIKYYSESKVVQSEKHLDEGEVVDMGEVTPEDKQLEQMCELGTIVLCKQLPDMRLFAEFIPVNPATHVLEHKISKSSVLVSPIGVVARMHKYWSADLIYTFTISAPQLLRGRVYIQYRPPGVHYGIVSRARDGIGTFPTYIMDLSTTRRKRIKVPMSPHRAYFHTEYPDQNLETGVITDVQTQYDACNGHFIVSSDTVAFSEDRIGCVLAVKYTVENLSLMSKRNIESTMRDDDIMANIRRQEWNAEAALIPLIAGAIDVALEVIPVVEGALKLHDTFKKKTKHVNENAANEATTVDQPKERKESKTLYVCRIPPVPVRSGFMMVNGYHRVSHPERTDKYEYNNFFYLRFMYAFMRGSFVQTVSTDALEPMVGVSLYVTTVDDFRYEIEESEQIIPMTNAGGGHININGENITVSVPFNKMILMEHTWVNPDVGQSYGKDETYAVYDITHCKKYRVTHKLGDDFRFIHLIGGLLMERSRYEDPERVIKANFINPTLIRGRYENQLTKRQPLAFGQRIFDAIPVEPLVREKIVLVRPDMDDNDYEALAKTLLVPRVAVSKGQAERAMNAKYQNGNIDILCAMIVKLSENVAPIHPSMAEYVQAPDILAKKKPKPKAQKTMLQKALGSRTPRERGDYHGFTDFDIDKAFTSHTLRELIQSQIGILYDYDMDKKYGRLTPDQKKEYLSCVYKKINGAGKFVLRSYAEINKRYSELRQSYYAHMENRPTTIKDLGGKFPFIVLLREKVTWEEEMQNVVL